jgi:hypothetical protein
MSKRHLTGPFVQGCCGVQCLPPSQQLLVFLIQPFLLTVWPSFCWSLMQPIDDLDPGPNIAQPKSFFLRTKNCGTAPRQGSRLLLTNRSIYPITVAVCIPHPFWTASSLCGYGISMEAAYTGRPAARNRAESHCDEHGYDAVNR